MFKFTLFLFLTTCICSCSGTPESPLLGTWNETGSTGDETLIFHEDGSISANPSDPEIFGEWRLDSDVDPMLLSMNVSEGNGGLSVEIISAIRFLSPNEIEICVLEYIEESGVVHKEPAGKKSLFIRQPGGDS